MRLPRAGIPHLARRSPDWLGRTVGACLLASLIVLIATDAASALTMNTKTDAAADVSQGAALLKQGNYQAVVSMETAALNTPLSQQDAATALYYRGLAYRKLGRGADAIADLGGAMYLGLPTTQRIVAQVQRSYIYHDLGLEQQSQHEIALAKMAAPHETSELLRQGDVIGSIATASPSSVVSYGGWWDRITGGFGSSRAAAPAPEPAPAVQPAVTTATRTPAPTAGTGTNGWSITVEQADRAVASERASKAKAAKPANPPASSPAVATPTPAPLPAQTASDAPDTTSSISPSTGSSGSTIGRWIGSWTGSSSASSAPQPAAPAQPATSGWTTETHAAR